MSLTDKISAETIKEYLRPCGLAWVGVEVYDSLPSTNTRLKEYAAEDAPHGTVLIAREQTAGRGRMGRSFHSPSGGGLYMSILTRPRMAADKVLLMTPLTAVAVCRALEGFGSPRTDVKWVNDVYINGKKAAGILVEGTVTQDGGIDCAVVGVGVNLSPPDGGFPSDISDTACVVFDSENSVSDVNRLISELIREFFSLYDALPNCDFMEDYRRRSFLLGKEVTVSRGGENYFGTAVEIDRDARLVVECCDGVRRIFDSGEARAKPLAEK